MRRVDKCLSTVAALGYRGIELGQHPSCIGNVDSRELARMLADYDLTLAGMAFGSVDERIRFCGDNLRPDYLCVDRLDVDDLKSARQHGFRIALHPHAFKKIRREEDFREELDRAEFDDVLLILDTGHASISNVDSLQFVDHWSSRLAAVHLNEWLSDYGRASHRYFEGFVPLGASSTSRLEDTIGALTDASFREWLVVEHAGVEYPHLGFLQQSTDWLRNTSLVDFRPYDASKLAFEIEDGREPEAITDLPKARVQSELQCRSTLTEQSFKPSEHFFAGASEAIGALSGAVCTSIWNINTARETVGCMAWFPQHFGKDYQRETVLEFSQSFGAKVASKNRLSWQDDLTNENLRKAFAQKKLLEAHPDIRSIATIPVYSPGNLSHPRFFFSLLCREPLSNAEIHILDDIARLFGRLAEYVADTRARELVAASTVLWNRFTDLTRFGNELAVLIKKRVPCEGVTIFLRVVSEDGDESLVERGTTGIRWFNAAETTSSRECYNKGEGITGTVWRSRDVLMIQSPDEHSSHIGKSAEEVSSKNVFSTLWIPISDSGDPVGVIRCRNRLQNRGPQSAHAFTDDDASVVLTLAEAIAPYIGSILAEEVRRKVLQRLSHEVKTPLRLLGSAADCIRFLVGEKEPKQGSKNQTTSHLDSLDGAIHLTRHLIKRVDFFRHPSTPLRFLRQQFRLLEDVVEPLLEEMKLIPIDEALVIRDATITGVPSGLEIHGDREAVAACIFEALWNSACFDGDNIQVVAGHCDAGKSIYVRVSDDGIGFASSDSSDRLFDEGIRGSRAPQYHQLGCGLGLWIIKRTLDTIQGSYQLLNSTGWTTLEMQIPVYWPS